MNPLRSPRFQSDAERCSIAAISCDGFPNGIFGAEHPIVIDMGTTYHAPRTFFSLTWPRERLVETLPRVSQRAGLAAAFLLGGLFLFLRRLFLSFWPRLFGGVLFFSSWLSSWPSAWKRDATLPSGRMVSAQDSAPTGTSAP